MLENKFYFRLLSKAEKVCGTWHIPVVAISTGRDLERYPSHNFVGSLHELNSRPFFAAVYAFFREAR